MALSSKIISLHPRTDRRVVVGTGKDARTFEVSSYAMCLACPAWERMFKHPDPNAKITYTEQSATGIPFPEDDPEAMELILRIVHCCLHNSLAPPGIRLAKEVAMLCNKYDLVYETQDWIDKWKESMIEEIEKIRGLKFPTPRLLDCLNVSYVFGWEEILGKIVKDIGHDVIIEEKDGQTILSYCEIDVNLAVLPNIAKQFRTILQTTMASIIALVRRFFEDLSGESQCWCGFNDPICDTIFIGSLVQCLCKVDYLIPIVTSGQDNHTRENELNKVSFNKLHNALRHIESEINCRKMFEAGEGKNHSKCFTTILGRPLDKILLKMDLSLWELCYEIAR